MRAVLTAAVGVLNQTRRRPAQGDSPEAKAIIEAWRRDYNGSRPHMTLNGLSPAEFAHAADLTGRQHGLMKAEN
ncbi:integrase core domain-containing protein [Noviherbaspirillum pedocola]|uniref:integrase core domain-containing protein n=1 Tax=Noviherbaspirillum pedocola TaxID=2801341 RepID=UPI003899578D